jgi:hypothetical protein
VVESLPEPEQPLFQPAESFLAYSPEEWFLEFPLAPFLVRVKQGSRQELPLAARVLNPASLPGRLPESQRGQPEWPQELLESYPEFPESFPGQQPQGEASTPAHPFPAELIQRLSKLARPTDWPPHHPEHRHRPHPRLAGCKDTVPQPRPGRPGPVLPALFEY